MAILVGAEALFDLVHETAGTLRAHAGGAGLNTARTLGRLEADVHYLGCLSDDGFGNQLRAALVEDGVKLDTTVDTPLPTTLALVELDEGGSASYHFYTEGTSAPSLEPDVALSMLPDNVEMLHVGTLALVMEPTAIALQAVVEAVSATALVMVDPNCRPSFIADRDAFRASLATTLAYAHVVKVSEDDLRYLSPELDAVAAARALLEDGPRVALVTLGGDGARIVTADGDMHVEAPKITVADTIGAGDAFGGGFLAYLQLKGLGRSELGDPDAVRAATRFACVVAARTCERPGASPPRLSELDGDL